MTKLPAVTGLDMSATWNGLDLVTGLHMERRRPDIRILSDGAFPGHVPQMGILTPLAAALLAQADRNCTELAKEVRSRTTDVEMGQCHAPRWCSTTRAYRFCVCSAMLVQHYPRLQVLRCTHVLSWNQMKVILDHPSLKQLDLSGLKIENPWKQTRTSDMTWSCTDCVICLDSNSGEPDLVHQANSHCPSGTHCLCAGCIAKLPLKDNKIECPACRTSYPLQLWRSCESSQEQVNSLMWLPRYIRKMIRAGRKPVALTMPNISDVDLSVEGDVMYPLRIQDLLPSQINIKVEDTAGRQVFFKIKMATQMKKLIAAYCMRTGNVTDGAVFKFDQIEIRPTDTPLSVRYSHGARLIHMRCF